MFSGGKDSTYLLWLLTKEYKLNVLAFTTRNEFMSPTAYSNIEQAIAATGADHLWAEGSPSLLRKLLSERLTYSSFTGLPTVDCVCKKCSMATNLLAVKAGVDLDIPIIMNGLSPYQIGNDKVYKISYSAIHATVRKLYCSPIDLFGVKPTLEELLPFLIPEWPDVLLPVILYPFNAIGYNLRENNKTILTNGLLTEGNEHPLKSNCLVNLLMIKYETMRSGSNPYLEEFSDLIREGQIDQEEWTQLANDIGKQIDDGSFAKEEINKVLDSLGLEMEGLEIDYKGGV
jgi:hypothetical protein